MKNETELYHTENEENSTTYYNNYIIIQTIPIQTPNKQNLTYRTEVNNFNKKDLLETVFKFKMHDIINTFKSNVGHNCLNCK